MSKKVVSKPVDLTHEELLRKVVHTIAENSLHDDPEIVELLKRFRLLTK